MPMVDVLRSSSTVVYVPVIMRVVGSAPDSGHREFGGHSNSQQRQVLDFQQWSYGGDDGFLTHFASFFALLRLSGVERQFFELSSAHTCECSRAPVGLPIRTTVLLT